MTDVLDLLPEKVRKEAKTSEQVAEQLKLCGGHSDYPFKLWLPAEAVEGLRTNNCWLCHQRVFVLSGGTAECSEGCPNNLRGLAYCTPKRVAEEAK